MFHVSDYATPAVLRFILSKHWRPNGKVIAPTYVEDCLNSNILDAIAGAGKRGRFKPSADRLNAYRGNS